MNRALELAIELLDSAIEGHSQSGDVDHYLAGLMEARHLLADGGAGRVWDGAGYVPNVLSRLADAPAPDKVAKLRKWADEAEGLADRIGVDSLYASGQFYEVAGRLRRDALIEQAQR